MLVLGLAQHISYQNNCISSSGNKIRKDEIGLAQHTTCCCSCGEIGGLARKNGLRTLELEIAVDQNKAGNSPERQLKDLLSLKEIALHL